MVRWVREGATSPRSPPSSHRALAESDGARGKAWPVADRGREGSRKNRGASVEVWRGGKPRKIGDESEAGDSSSVRVVRPVENSIAAERSRTGAKSKY
ncbi:hypothetical protein KM043_006320 [Ampulex compressa]|nr:hypothetical protein KM043_006320 [Ampulex compressa]